MADDPFKTFKDAIAEAKAPLPPKAIPTADEARAVSEQLYADLIAAVGRFDTIAKEQDQNFSVRWRWERPDVPPGLPPITKATLVARKNASVRALEIPIQMQGENFWADDPVFKEPSGNGGGRWTPDRAQELIPLIGKHLADYFAGRA